MGLVAIPLLLGTWLLDPTKADEAGVAVRWEGAAECSCPSPTEVLLWIERALGRPVPDDVGLDAITIVVTNVSSDGVQAKLILSWAEEAERRALHGESCTAVARASALIVAVALDPLGAAAEMLASDVPDERSVPVDSHASSPNAVASESPAAEPRDMHAWSHRLRASGGVAYGALPSVGGVISLHYAAVHRRARLELGSLYGTPTAATYPDYPSAGGVFQLVAGSIRGCLALHAGRVELPLCGGADVGGLHARGRAEQIETRWRPWLALTADASTIIPLAKRVGVVAGMGLAVPLLRHRFHIDGLPPFFHVGPVGLRAIMGLEVSLGHRSLG
jgi:hypothetical protein